MIVNRGWVPLDFDLDSIDKSEDYKYIGKLMTYDTQTIGQDDVSQSNYLFRIDKLFIENYNILCHLHLFENTDTHIFFSIFYIISKL